MRAGASSFWIPGGVILLIVSVLLSSLVGLISRFYSFGAIAAPANLLLGAVAVAGVVCIITGVVVNLRSRNSQK
jgi:hypothetical protein